MQTSERLQLLPQYRDTTIAMEVRRGQHWYRVDGQEALLPSVTTFLKVIDKSGPLVGWARKDALEKAAAELHAQLQIAVPWRDEDQGPWVADVMAGAKDRIYRTKDSAAEAGTDAHELIAAILQGGSPMVPDALRPAVQGAQEMLADYRLSPVSIEHLVWHPSQQYAGTIDLVARDADGRLVVVDWKRAKGWHRYKMCQEAGIEPFFNPLPEGQDPVTFVITRNAHRRHLTRIQYRVGILMSRGIRGQGEYDRGKGAESAYLPPTIQQHIESFGGSHRGWMDALAIVKAGYGPQVMAGEPAQPFLDQIHQSKAGMDDEVSADSQPDESLAPGSGAEEETDGGGTDDVHTGDDGGHRTATGESETTQPDVGPEGDGPGVVTTPNTDDGPPAEKPPKPKGSTLTERLEAQVDALQMEVHEKAERIEGLEREVREAKGQQSEYPHEREAVANEREAMISALRGSMNEWQTKHNDERRRANWWERQARSLGWKREGQAEPPDPGKEAGPPEFPIYEGWDGQEHGEF